MGCVSIFSTCAIIDTIIHVVISLASNINTVFARPTSLEVPLSFDPRHHCHSHLVTGPLQHCRHCVEGTGGGLMEETAAVLSAASPSVDGMPSSSLCQSRQREQQKLLLLYVTKVDLKYTILTALSILVVYSQPHHTCSSLYPSNQTLFFLPSMQYLEHFSICSLVTRNFL